MCVLTWLPAGNGSSQQEGFDVMERQRLGNGAKDREWSGLDCVEIQGVVKA